MMHSAPVVSIELCGTAGDLIVRTWTSPSLLLAGPVFRLPLIRGIVVLGESLVLGTRALMISAGRAEQDDGPLTRLQVGLSVARSLGLTFLLFFVLPAAIARAAGAVLQSRLVQSIGEGALRIG